MTLKDPEDPTDRPARDGDGNALGGVRLPHMPVVLAGGAAAGAPLGSYSGYGPDPTVEEPGGSFYPFDEAELRERYPTHRAYVTAVSRGAAHAYDRGWILAEDRDAYVETAEKSDIGKRKKR